MQYYTGTTKGDWQEIEHRDNPFLQQVCAYARRANTTPAHSTSDWLSHRRVSGLHHPHEPASELREGQGRRAQPRDGPFLIQLPEDHHAQSQGLRGDQGVRHDHHTASQPADARTHTALLLLLRRSLARAPLATHSSSCARIPRSNSVPSTSSSSTWVPPRRSTWRER